MKLDLPARTAASAGCAKIFRVDVPLVGEPRLDHRAGTVAMRHDVEMRLDLIEKPALFHHLDDALPRVEAVETIKFPDRRSELR